MDGIERVEELLLRPLLVRDELDVIDEQQVDAPVARPEVVEATLLDAGDELVGELLAGDVDDALAREAGDDGVADGVHQVGLAEADAAVQEQWVVGVTGALRDRQARGVCEAIGGADDEGPEGVAGVEADRATLGSTDPAGLQPDPCRPAMPCAGGGSGLRPPSGSSSLSARSDGATSRTSNSRVTE